MPTLSLESVTKDFDGVRAVDAVDLHVADGALLSLLGPSGCGKTTTLRLVAGLEHLTAGMIHIGGDCVSSASRFVPPNKRDIGMVFQSYAIWPHLTAFENVAFPLLVRRLSRAEVRARTDAALHLVELGPYASRGASQLSGGQQQRVALARALVFEPRILLLDEPLSNLDEKLRETMREEIRALQQRVGITSLYVTHDQREALAVSDIIAVMSHGRVVQFGTPREIYETPKTRFVAEFAGWSNFIDGNAVSRNEVKVNGLSGTLRCMVPESVVGGQVAVGIRPEAIVISEPDSNMENTFRGRIESRIYAGEHLSCQIRLDGVDTLLHARLPPRTDSSASEVAVSLPAGRLLVVEQ